MGGAARGSPPSLGAEAQPARSSGPLVARLPLPWATSCVSPESSCLAFWLPGHPPPRPESQAGGGRSLSACRQGGDPSVRSAPRGLGPSGTPLRAPLSCLPAGKWHLGHHGSYHPNFRGKDSRGTGCLGNRGVCAKRLTRFKPSGPWAASLLSRDVLVHGVTWGVRGTQGCRSAHAPVAWLLSGPPSVSPRGPLVARPSAFSLTPFSHVGEQRPP